MGALRWGNLHSFSVQWLLHLFGLLVLAIVIGCTLFFEHTRIEQRERAHLLHQSTVVETVLNKKFEILDTVLRHLRDGTAANKAADAPDHDLQLLATPLPGVEALNILDARGVIRASSNPAWIGRDCGKTAFFSQLARNPDPDRLALTVRPETPGQALVAVGLPRKDAQGAFAGIVSASLSPRFFLPLLEAVRYAPDMAVQLLSADGVQLLALGPTATGRSRDVRTEYILRHIRSGQSASLVLEKGSATCPALVMAIRTVHFTHPQTSAPFVVGVCRDPGDVYALWRKDIVLLVGMLAALAVFSSLVLGLFQKWQRDSDRKIAKTAAALVERDRFIRLITDNVPTQIAYWDNSLHCQYANNAYMQWFGKTAEAMENISVRDLLGEEAFARSEPYMRATLAGEPQLFERMVLRPDGSAGYNQVRYIPNQMNGEVNGMFVLAVDVTELKRTQAELEQRVHELHTQATTDALTGLANRRFFMDRAAEELARNRRYKQPLAMLMVDVDHFKNVNDTYGHDIGDALLRALAATMQETMRTTDIVARVGGEEFAVLLLHTDKPTAKNAAERLREALGKTCIQTGTNELCFTVSIGMASDAGGELTSVDELLKRADLALYQAKANGRDQVCCHGES